MNDAARPSEIVQSPLERLKITEIFLSLQGEANAVGWPTVFVRLTGCPKGRRTRLGQRRRPSWMARRRSSAVRATSVPGYLAMTSPRVRSASGSLPRP